MERKFSESDGVDPPTGQEPRCSANTESDQAIPEARYRRKMKETFRLNVSLDPGAHIPGALDPWVQGH